MKPVTTLDTECPVPEGAGVCRTEVLVRVALNFADEHPTTRTRPIPTQKYARLTKPIISPDDRTPPAVPSHIDISRPKGQHWNSSAECRCATTFMRSCWTRGNPTALAGVNRNVRNLRNYLIAAIALAIVTAGCSSGHTTRPASSSVTTTTTTNGTGTTTPRSAAGLTAEQLNAHLGVGVPAGWAPVDEGEARVWVPNDWMFAAGPQAQVNCASSAPGLISLGSIPFGCRSLLQSGRPSQMIAILPLSQTHRSQPSSTIHGYRVYHHTSTIRYSSVRNRYDVPQLHISIASYGTLSTRVLDTLAPSAREVALAFANEAVPNDSHRVRTDGMILAIPPFWRVNTPEGMCVGLWIDSELVRIKPDIGDTASCGPPGPSTASDAVHADGMILYLPPNNSFAPSPYGRPLATLHRGTTTIAIYAEKYDHNALDLFVHRAGSKITHVLTLGLGRDGRVAGGVLGSIRATT